jgi:hypothetical protein
MLIEYVDEHKKMPSGSNKDDDIRYLGKWVGTQKRIFKTKTQIMKNQIIHDKWKKFLDENSQLFQ